MNNLVSLRRKYLVRVIFLYDYRCPIMLAIRDILEVVPTQEVITALRTLVEATANRGLDHGPTKIGIREAALAVIPTPPRDRTVVPTLVTQEDQEAALEAVIVITRTDTGISVKEE